MFDVDVTEKVTLLLERCRQQEVKLRTAESCTAGAIAAAIATVSGASDVLDCGWIVYSNQSKVSSLKVDPSLIENQGAVSLQVVEQMATQGSVLDESKSRTICVAVSGVAGPAGGTPEKPVGTVWMGIASDGNVIYSHCFQFSGKREDIQMQTVRAALEQLLIIVSE